MLVPISGSSVDGLANRSPLAWLVNGREISDWHTRTDPFRQKAATQARSLDHVKRAPLRRAPLVLRTDYQGRGRTKRGKIGSQQGRAAAQCRPDRSRHCLRLRQRTPMRFQKTPIGRRLVQVMTAENRVYCFVRSRCPRTKQSNC